MTDPGREAARAVLDLAAGRAATLGGGRLICIDGPAGSGKTTLATAVAEPSGALVLHMDDHYEGWAGLGDAPARIRDQILQPLARGEEGHYHRYDWDADGWAEQHTVPPSALLVVEGVGSGSCELAAHCTVLVWVEADRDVRLARGLARDGEAMRDHWLRWMDDEAAHFDRHRTRERADLVLDGVGRLA